MDLRAEIAQSKECLLSDPIDNVEFGMFLSHFLKSVIILNFCYQLGYFFEFISLFCGFISFFVTE